MDHPPCPRHASFALINPLMAVADKQAKPIYTSRFASSGIVDFVHSAAVTALPDGSLMAVWFADVMAGAIDSVFGIAGSSANDGAVQGEHRYPGAGSLQASMGLRDFGTRARDQCISDSG